MTKPSRIWVILGILVLDFILAGTVLLIAQFLETGFDSIFYFPLFTLPLALFFVFLESYLPFLVIYGFVFSEGMTRLSATASCWLLLLPLLAVSVSIALLSFGSSIRAIEIAIPVGLAVVNVTAFWLLSARRD